MSYDLTLDDFRAHFEAIRKGGIKNLISRMPGMAAMVPKGENPDAALQRVQGMIDSMTRGERRDPEIIDASRRHRVAAGAGVQPHEVSQFLKNFDTARAHLQEMRSKSLWQRLLWVFGFNPFPPLPPPS